MEGFLSRWTTRGSATRRDPSLGVVIRGTTSRREGGPRPGPGLRRRCGAKGAVPAFFHAVLRPNLALMEAALDVLRVFAPLPRRPSEVSVWRWIWWV